MLEDNALSHKTMCYNKVVQYYIFLNVSCNWIATILIRTGNFYFKKAVLLDFKGA